MTRSLHPRASTRARHWTLTFAAGLMMALTSNSFAQDPAAEARAARDALPEIIVLYGREEMVPWLEIEDWWGPVNPNEQLQAPHVIVTAFHPSWAEFAAKLPVQTKKQLFYRLMLPLVMHANMMVTNLREQLMIAQQEFEQNGRLSAESLDVVRRGAFLLPGREDDGAEDILADDPRMAEMLDALLYRVDIVPNGLALGQAAYESGYGTSRFATEGNSLFGQWTYKGEGLKPREQRTQSKGDHRIRAFEWPFDSVRAYFINLMTHRAYEDFRRLRADLRAQGKPLDSMTLADGLTSYSERGQAYVDSLKGIMRVNNLTIADDAVFRDEPMRFLLSEQSLADVAAMNNRIDAAAASGELEEIIARMRLE